MRGVLGCLGLGLGGLATMMACASSGAGGASGAGDASDSRDGDGARSGPVLYVGPRFVVPGAGGVGGAGDVAGGTAEAVLVEGGRVAAVYAHAGDVPADVSARAPRRELPGVLALPGLVDAHLHVTWIGRAQESLDLEGARSPAEVRARLAAFAVAHPDVPVIVGNGWDHTLWGGEFPSAADLAPAPGEAPDALARPALLSRVDGHAVWLNPAAMARAAAFFASGEVAPGMRIERDASGRPTGVVTDPSPTLMKLVVPEPTRADLERWIGNGLAACARVGLVEVHDMATSTAELDVMLALAAKGPLPVRVVVYLDDAEASFARLAAAGGPRALAPDVWLAGMKLFADGALGSRGAALKADYSDHHGHRGEPTGRDALVAKAVRAAALGFPVAIHAIGDLGNDHALAAIEAAEAAHPRGDLVHRVEHAQVLDLGDLARFVATRAVASMQPTHATSDMRWAEARVGPERIKGAYAWNTILHRGIPLAFGSDAPVEDEAPLPGLFAAVFRMTAKGDPPGGWRPSEALSFNEALDAFTAGAARAAPGLGRTGRLEPGAPFEVTLLDRDVRADPQALLTATVVGTIRAERLR